MSSFRRWLPVAMVALLGCSKKEDPGPPCAQVAEHVGAIAKVAYPGHGEMDMMGPSAKKAWVAGCEQRKFTAKQRRCMLEAKSMEAIAECQAKGPKKEGGGGHGGTPAPGAGPVPSTPPPAAPSGGLAPAPAAPSPGAPTPGPAAPAPAAPAPAAPAPAAPAPAAPAPK